MVQSSGTIFSKFARTSAYQHGNFSSATTAMPDKRKASMPVPSSKWPLTSYDDEGGEKPYSHPLYGHNNAFLGLDDANN
ncbi:hypothetical protein N7540_013014 [Penicillium herquei]|nr:hypothetical protein N7540_013014 [Penicillium herquei]